MFDRKTIASMFLGLGRASATLGTERSNAHYISSLTPLRISRQFIGYEVMNQRTIAICIINQNSTVSVFKSISNPRRKMMK